MKSIATTKMSSRGQIVIPEKIRKSMHLVEGNQFVVLSEKDVIILKVVTPPSMKDFDNLITRARFEAKKAGVQKNDIKKIIADVRREKDK